MKQKKKEDVIAPPFELICNSFKPDYLYNLPGNL